MYYALNMNAVYFSVGKLTGISMSLLLSTFYRYRHRNLVELMGFCYKPKAIVYEFMERGNLLRNLHGKVMCSLIFAKL